MKLTNEGMQLEKSEIKTEVQKAMRLCDEIIRDGQDMDIDDVQHAAKKILIALTRVNKDLL
ncbi:MAG TPA: hypothetical protein VJH22_02000 [Candidatus Nanoarchaeia archaeon]|nr:hypothetical protein [Candidatus Nanoarchaeia archaeon]